MKRASTNIFYVLDRKVKKINPHREIQIEPAIW